MIIFILIYSNISLFGCIENNKINIEKNYEINIAISQDISGFYPWIIRDTISLSINQNFFNPLVEIDNETRGIIPSLAKNWNNPDELTWRFFLREGVKFHNGNNFTSEDVKFTIEYLKNFGFYYDRLSSIINISIIDNHTIDIFTDKKNTMLLYELISVNILSKDYVNNTNYTNESWPIGTGAYKLEEYEPNNHITLIRFEEYWKKKPQVKKVNFIVKNDYNQMITFLKNQELDIIPLPFDKIENITDKDNLKVLSVDTPGVVYLGFDFRVNNSYGYPNGKNPTSNIKVRKAIYHAINIEEFIEEKNNITNRKPITQLITSETFGYNPNIKRLDYNITKAKQLLNETEYSKGFNITLDCPDSNYSLKLCNLIVNQLSKININVTLHPLPSNKNLEKIFLKNTSFYITGFSPLTAEGTISLLLQTSNLNQGKGIWNYGNYSNIEIDILSEIIENTSDPNIKQELIQNVFAISMKDVACIPLYSSIAFYGIQNHIEWNPRPSLFVIVEDININKQKE